MYTYYHLRSEFIIHTLTVESNRIFTFLPYFSNANSDCRPSVQDLKSYGF